MSLYKTHPHLFGLDDQNYKKIKDSDQLLHPRAIDSLQALTMEAKTIGVELRILSGFRSFESQKKIWNQKFLGKRPVLDCDSRPLKRDSCSEDEWINSILRWSAFPGLSRHHWGTDFDIYDERPLKDNPNYQIELVPYEYSSGGIFENLGTFLDENLAATEFFRPYSKDMGGVAPEPWHISYGGLSREYFELVSLDAFSSFLETQYCQDILGIDLVKRRVEEIFQRFYLGISS